MKAGAIHLSTDLLRHLLRLPADVELADVHVDDNYFCNNVRTIRVLLLGERFADVAEGEKVPLYCIHATDGETWLEQVT